MNGAIDLDRAATEEPSERALGVSGVVCTYTEERWDQFVAAVDSLRTQSLSPEEIVVIVDHNRALFERARAELTDVVVVENAGPRGLSGAKNTALQVAASPVVAFLDDDAVAHPDWLRLLLRHFRDANVVGAGGRVTPNWLTGRPSWFPQEFDWVVGCTYRGSPEVTTPVRNPMGGAMAMRRNIVEFAGPYRTDLGRVGKHPLGCEETELCIRARQRRPEISFLFDHEAEILHMVPAERATWRYFRRRCYAEGLSKALVGKVCGTTDGLGTERSYVARALPAGVARGLRDSFRDQSGVLRAGAIIAGLAWTTAGYCVGRTKASPSPLP